MTKYPGDVFADDPGVIADNPGVRFPPPLLFVGGLAAAALLHSYVPLPLHSGGEAPVVPDFSGDAGRALMLTVAYVLLVAGFAWIVWGLITFRNARTGIYPNRPATQIVQHGPYRFGRNPMYVGMTAIYWGVALWLSTWWAVIIFPFVIILLLRFVIAREERYLRAAFPAEYDDYCRRVPRWLGMPR